MDGQNNGNNYQDNTANIPYQTTVEPSEPAKANALQIVGLICGIAGIILGCCTGWGGLILGVIGLICAIIGNKQGKTGVGTGGLVCSIISIVLSLIVVIVSFVFGAALLAYLAEYGYYY